MLDTPLTRSRFLARSDPRVRLLAAFACSIALSTLASVEAAMPALALAGLALLCARPLPGAVLGRLAVVNAFLLFLAAGLSLDFVQDPGSLFPLPVLVDRRPLIALIALKANAIVCCLMLFLGSMAPSTMGYAMDRLHVPPTLVCLFLFTLRFVHAIRDELERLLTAARLRGFVPRTSLHCYRTYATLLGVLLLHSCRRARRVHEAMLLRGFSGRFRVVTSYRAGWRDAVLAALVLVALSGVVGLDHGMPAMAQLAQAAPGGLAALIRP